MKKAKIALLAFVVAVLSVCCFAFMACDGRNPEAPPTKYNLTWTVNENLTVAVAGYDALPTEVVENTELSFTVTPKTTGWAVSSVSPSASVKKQSDGSYKVTVTKDLEIRVNAREEVESLTVTAPESIVYYAGEKFFASKDDKLVTPDGYTIKAKFKTGREADLTADDYIVEYQVDGAETFTLGDTSFKITYGGISKELQLAGAVKGRIKLNLDADGYWDEEARAALNEQFGAENILLDVDTKNNNNVICSLLFDEPFEEAYTLPHPTKMFTNKAGSEIPFPFKQWNGLEGGIVPKGTATSLEAGAIYSVLLVQFDSLSFTTKTVTEGDAQVSVPYFVIVGKFLAADSAQLVLKEGNTPVTELLGTRIEMQENDDNFELVFDLRQLVRWVNPDANATAKKNLKNSWNDIRFRASQGASSVDQVIDLNDYDDDFVDLGDTLEAEVDGTAYQFSYKVWSGDGAIGRDLKLVYEDCPDTVAKKVNLVSHEFTVTTLAETEGAEPTVTTETLPAMEIIGKNFSATTEAELKTLAEGYLTKPEALEGPKAYRPIDMKKDVTVNFAEHTFTIYLSIDDVQKGEVVFLHKGAGGNFENVSIGTNTLATDDLEYNYRLRLFSGATGSSNTWKNGLVVVECKSNREATANPVTIAVEGDKAYLVITGTYKNYATAEEFIAKIGQLDFENANDGQDKTVLDKSKITVVLDAANGTYTLKADITELKAGEFWVHLTGVLPGNGDIANDAGFAPVTCGTRTYGYVEKTFDWGKKHVLTIVETQPPEAPAE